MKMSFFRGIHRKKANRELWKGSFLSIFVSFVVQNDMTFILTFHYQSKQIKGS